MYLYIFFLNYIGKHDIDYMKVILALGNPSVYTYHDLRRYCYQV